MRLLIGTTATGGELFPGIAVAEALREGEVLFVTTGLGPDVEALRRYGFPYVTLSVGRLLGQAWWDQIKTLGALPSAVLKSVGFIRRFGADHVLGCGGYTSGPVVLAAFLLRIPRAILEPNTIPGLTNRVLGRLVDRIYCGFPEMDRFHPAKRIRWTGLPIRQALCQVRSKDGGEFTLLVLGGSRGARRLNQVVSEAVSKLAHSGVSLRLIHQTGRLDYEEVLKGYRSLKGFEGRYEVHPFIEKIERAYESSDLVIGRAGASTIAELIATARPSILVPYPFATGNHQKRNASWLVGVGGAEMILEEELEGGERLARQILPYFKDRSLLEKRRRALAGLPIRGAAGAVVQDLGQLGARH